MLLTDFISLIVATCTLIIPQIIVIMLIMGGARYLSSEFTLNSNNIDKTANNNVSYLNKPFELSMNKGVVLISLAILLQMFIIIYSKDINKKDIDKKEEKDKITCEKTDLKDENSQTSAMSFIINNNTEQEQNSTYSASTPTKNNSSQIITTKKDNKTNECK